jgi:hypothetical protein
MLRVLSSGQLRREHVQPDAAILNVDAQAIRELLGVLLDVGDGLVELVAVVQTQVDGGDVLKARELLARDLPEDLQEVLKGEL